MIFFNMLINKYFLLYIHLHGPGGPLILVLGHAVLGPVVVVVPAVERLQHVVGTSHAAALSLGFLNSENIKEKSLFIHLSR